MPGPFGDGSAPRALEVRAERPQEQPVVQVDFNQVDDVDNFASVPNGVYVCRVGEIRPRLGDDGSERWGIRWIVCEGPYAGRTAAWDSLAFNPRGLRRAKLILQRLLVPTEGPREIRPADVEGKVARVNVYARERVDAVTGRRVISNRVPFAGVESASDAEWAAAARSAAHEAPTEEPFNDEGLEE